MRWQTPRATRTDTLVPYTTLFRSGTGAQGKGLTFAVLPPIQCIRHAHAFACNLHLVLVEDKADFTAMRERSDGKESREHAHRDGQNTLQRTDSPVLADAGGGPYVAIAPLTFRLSRKQPTDKCENISVTGLPERSKQPRRGRK